MPEVSQEQANRLARLEAQDERTRKYNRARSKSITQLCDAHRAEYDRYMEANKATEGIS